METVPTTIAKTVRNRIGLRRRLAHAARFADDQRLTGADVVLGPS
jgi:hypothetical protein